MVNWNEIGHIVLIIILKCTLKELEKRKKCKGNVDSKYGKILKRSNKSNEIKFLKGYGQGNVTGVI